MTQEESVMATNLPESWLEINHIGNLYKMRWEIEIFQKDFIMTAHGKIWHSRTENGILQEFYAKFWLINVTRALMTLCGEKLKDINERTYIKSNFKLCFHIIAKNLKKWINSPTSLIVKLIKTIKRTRETRSKNSRNYSRVIKVPANKYPYDNTVLSMNRPPPTR